MKKLENAPVADRAGIVALATTAELVEWYNAHSSAPVKKFADRKTAERRVLALLADGVKVDHSAANKRIAAATPELKKATVKKVVADEAADRSAAVAGTWLDPAVAASRAIRDHVMVDGVWFVSVRQAFIDLNLPLNEHIKFRAKLKHSRNLESYGYKWSITKEQR